MQAIYLQAAHRIDEKKGFVVGERSLEPPSYKYGRCIFFDTLIAHQHIHTNTPWTPLAAPPGASLRGPLLSVRMREPRLVLSPGPSVSISQDIT